MKTKTKESKIISKYAALIASLFVKSLEFDIRFLFLKYPKGFGQKIEFLAKKYFTLLKHLILKTSVNVGASKINLAGEDIYYESEYGITNFQALLVNFQRDYMPYLKHLKNPTIVDVGAHVGFFSLAVVKFFNNANVYSCEPVGLAFDVLKKNTANIENVHPFRVGFSSKKSPSKIYFIKDRLIVSSIFSERFDWGEKPSAEMIQLDTLDSFIKRERIPEIDILKIDTEGSEEKILEGASETLAKTRFLILEISLYKTGGSTFASVIHHLYGKEYNFQLVNIQTPFFRTLGDIATVDMLFENTELVR